jgi:glutamate synthase (NADPH/NADH) small chain
VISDAKASLSPKDLLAEFDAVVRGGRGASRATCRSRAASSPVCTRHGLPAAANKRVAGDQEVKDLWATDKHVVIIGGGDTGRLRRHVQSPQRKVGDAIRASPYAS